MPPNKGHNGIFNLNTALQIIAIPKRIIKMPKKISLRQKILYHIVYSIGFGVSGGDRTHDPQNHNLMLYQLSYTHHNGTKVYDFMHKINIKIE